MLYMPLECKNNEVLGLLGTGGVQSALSGNENRKFLATYPNVILDKFPPPMFQIRITVESAVPVRQEVTLYFENPEKEFEQMFMVLPMMGNTLIGMSFHK